jgi:hypothetical protein
MMLAMAPLGPKAADLVVWWREGFYARRTIDFALKF